MQHDHLPRGIRLPSRQRLSIFGLAAGLIAFLPAVAVAVSSGDLDTTFGPAMSGTTSLPNPDPSDEGQAVALQETDHFIVVAGNAAASGGEKVRFSVARFDTFGNLDTNFNATPTQPTADVPGIKTINPGAPTGNSRAAAVAIQSDGKIVIAGYATVSAKDGFALARLNANGTPDLGFGSSGTVRTAPDANTLNKIGRAHV